MSNSFIPCQICGHEFKQIAVAHLKTHGSTMAQYRSQFPDAPLVSEATKRKIREAQLGEKHHSFGKTFSEETRKKMSEAMSGRKFSDEHKRKLSKSMRGVPKTEEHRRKLSEAHLGKKHTEATRQKLREVNSGEKNHNFGKTTPEATRRKQSETRIELFRSGELEISPLIGHANGGFREDLGHFVRSTWEANVARIFIHEGIEYQYEPERFDLGELGTYLPDFYIPDSDLYLEVKGYMTPEAQAKIDLFSKDHDLLVIDAKRYKELKEKYESVIENWNGISQPEAIKEEFL